MTKASKLRIFGGVILLFILWFIGDNHITGAPAFLLPVGFVVAFEFVVVQRRSKPNDEP
jgi:hypothetical protein